MDERLTAIVKLLELCDVKGMGKWPDAVEARAVLERYRERPVAEGLEEYNHQGHPRTWRINLGNHHLYITKLVDRDGNTIATLTGLGGD
jgi:hypothetical protein